MFTIASAVMQDGWVAFKAHLLITMAQKGLSAIPIV
jgi:hypothetical protein